MPEHVQIVLSGGRSSRMGEPKARLDFDGITALSLVLDAARDIVFRQIVVISPAGSETQEQHERALPQVEWVVNEEPDAEQIDSLACGLEAIRDLPTSAGFFVHPVDFPLATRQDYNDLADAMRADMAEEFLFFKPRAVEGGRHGHPILCRQRTLGRFVEVARKTGGTARDVIHESATRSVEVANEHIARDMDTPEDYRELLEIYRARQPR